MTNDKPSVVATEQQQAAAVAKAAAVAVIHLAAQNAAKPGWFSSEFLVSALGVVGAIVLPVIGLGPIGIGAAVVLSAVVATYNLSRGNVKTTALSALSAVAKEVPIVLPGNALAAAGAGLVAATIAARAP